MLHPLDPNRTVSCPTPYSETYQAIGRRGKLGLPHATDCEGGCSGSGRIPDPDGAIAEVERDDFDSIRHTRNRREAAASMLDTLRECETYETPDGATYSKSNLEYAMRGLV